MPDFPATIDSMHLRNGGHGYGVVTKALHWLTVVLFALQFWVGYTMETDREVARVEDRPTALHVGLGVTLLLLGALRVAWRRAGSLPPWSPRLASGGRKVEGMVEKALLGLMFAVPASGLLLLVADDLVALHVAAHVAFFVALAVHLGVVLGHRLLPRMLPFTR